MTKELSERMLVVENRLVHMNELKEMQVVHIDNRFDALEKKIDEVLKLGSVVSNNKNAIDKNKYIIDTQEARIARLEKALIGTVVFFIITVVERFVDFF